MECPLMRNKGYKGGAKVCLSCPYPKCVYDFTTDKSKEAFIRRMSRNDAIVAMRHQKNTQAVADRFGLSRSQVKRIVAQYEKMCQLCEKEFDRGQLA